MANDHDLEFLGSQFALELEGVELARFTGCSGLSYTTEVVEYQDTVGGKIVIRKRPGRTKYDDIVLKRGLSADSASMRSVCSSPGRRAGGLAAKAVPGSSVR